jgi:hypothetical protein
MVTLKLLSDISIVRYTKVKKDATPFDPTWDDYFEQRQRQSKLKRSYGKLAKPVHQTGLNVVILNFELLEPYAAKVSYTVLAGESGSNAADLLSYLRKCSVKHRNRHRFQIVTSMAENSYLHTLIQEIIPLCEFYK